jgi:hypothetical protein
MNAEQILGLWSDSTAFSALIWLVVVLVGLLLLYLARRPAHDMLLGSGRALRQACRLAERSVMLAELRVAERNREVLLAIAEENQGRFIEREFHRVNAIVSKDLSGYPALHRSLSDQIAELDEDYRQSTEVPPTPPAWVEAVDAVAKIPPSGDPVVAQVLEGIHATVERASRDALQEYREASRHRHLWLKRMMPHWRSLRQTLAQVERTINGLEKRSEVIDAQMARYEEVRAGSDRMVRTLASSSSSQFVISGLILVIAVLAGAVNFELIARPMSEMVGGTREVFEGVKVSDVAAMVIILLEITVGIFLMDSLRITRLLPIIGALDDKVRLRLVWFTFGILFFLAAIESGLAYMRDLLAAQDEALNQLLAAGSAEEVAAPAFRWIPSVAQMVLGFILPFALTLVAIPLESFIHSSRSVFGRLTGVVLRLVGFVLRLLGNLFAGLARTLVRLYDLLVFLPLSIDRAMRARAPQPALEPAPEAVLAPPVSALMPEARAERGAKK